MMLQQPILFEIATAEFVKHTSFVFRRFFRTTSGSFNTHSPPFDLLTIFLARSDMPESFTVPITFSIFALAYTNLFHLIVFQGEKRGKLRKWWTACRT